MKRVLSFLVAFMFFAVLFPSSVIAENYVGNWYAVAAVGLTEDGEYNTVYMADMDTSFLMQLFDDGSFLLTVKTQEETATAEGTWTKISNGISVSADGQTIKMMLRSGMLVAADAEIFLYFSRTSPEVEPHPELPLPDETYNDGTGIYSISGDTATFSKPATSGESIQIPAAITVNGKTVKVVAVADSAFQNDKKLTEVQIGKNVKTIGRNAFASCTALKTVKGGANVATIMDSVFSGCTALKTFPAMNKLQKIGANAFKGAKALASFTIARTVNSIGKNAFNGCAGLKTITVKAEKLTAKNVGAGAFKGINKKATFKCPKKQLKAYKTLFVKKGAPKTCKFK